MSTSEQLTQLLDLSRLPVTARAEIPESYLDEMGHVNVMWYTHLFSCAVWGLFDIIGFSKDLMKATQTGSFALEAYFIYRAEMKAGQRVTIRTRMFDRSPKRIHFIHFLTIDDAGDLLSATGEMLSAYVDMTVRRQSQFPDAIAATCDKLLTEHRTLSWSAPVCGTIHA